MAATIETQTETPVYVGHVVHKDSTYLGDYDVAYYVTYLDSETLEFKQYGFGWEVARWDDVAIDAPQDEQDLWADEREIAKAKSMRAYRATQIRERQRDERIPFRGKVVRVVRGRKVPIGTEGVVKVRCESAYGYHPSWRVCLVTDDGVEHWTDERNVEVIAQSK